MILFNSFRQYTQTVNSIKFSQDRKNPFLLVYLSENSMFIDDYPKLNLRRIDARYVVIPKTRIPLTFLKPELRKIYRLLGLLPVAANQKVPSGQNLIYDISEYLRSIDTTYKISNYRQRGGFLIRNILLNVFSSFPSNYKKVLIYSVDTTKEIKPLINRKIFPILMDMRKDEFYFDHLILSVLKDNGVSYRLLVKNKEFNFARLRQFINTIKFIDASEENEEEIKQATDIIMNKISPEISPENKPKYTNSISNFLKKDNSSIHKVISSDETNNHDDIKDVAVSSILYKVSGDIEKSKRIASAIPTSKKSISLKMIDKRYVDELIQPKKPITSSEDIVVQNSNIIKTVNNKAPDHLFEKRKMDFEVNLKKDMVNSFKVLSTKDVPLQFKGIRIYNKDTRAGELRRSDIAIIEVTLVDKFNRIHIVNLEIPKISEDGTFLVNGRRKCLINQIVLNPITFPKPYDSKFESSYSAFHIWSKRTKREEYLEVYLGSYKIPLMILLAYSFGFEETLKLYDITYEISDQKIKDKKFRSAIPNGKFILFNNVDSKLKEELCQSFIHSNVSSFKIDKEFGTREYFNELIIKITGRINSTYLIQSNLENIVDPVAKQILINKQLPSDLALIMKYMASRTVEGFEQKRNDISNQRIRNSEVLVHLAQKQILASYTEYKEQVLSGNKKADFTLSPTKVLSEFINSEIVADMEYANPIEEMATKTKVSPVGKAIGGIPDKVSIQVDARNVHDSMYGNIDTLDTPEGDNIGIVQQLTMDAYITSSRGIFNEKEKLEGEDSGLLSTSASQIPFVENDDGCRVMFSCNQQRQVVPLKNPSPPPVQTGYESILTSVLSDAFIKRSPCNGKVKEITSDFISITCSNAKTIKVDIIPVHLRSGAGKNTLSVFNPTVSIGQSVKEKQIIAEGSCISSGSISLGRNLCVAFMPYKGFNYEDGIVISESVAKEDLLTSLHGIIEEVQVDKSDRIIEIVKLGTNTTKGQTLIRKSIGEIDKLIGFDEEEEGTEIIAGQYIKKSPGGRVVDIEVFCNVRDSNFPIIQELSDRTRRRYNLKPGEKFTEKGEAIKGILIKFKIEQQLGISVGDKLTNRHGAKGIVSFIEKDENMPISPTGDRIDIILNPIGIIGRMNVGQLYELYTGLIAKELYRRIMVLKTKDKILPLLNRVLTELDGSKTKEFSKNLISNFRSMSDTLFKRFVGQVITSKNMTILIPPFKAPDYKNILEALKLLGLKAGYKLKLPEYNTTTQYPVAVGYIYTLKLEHLGDEKLHVRSTGPVVSKIFQPTSGKKREGGQRVGEMDTYSLISYNCPTLLEEFFGPLSDDHITKNELLSDIIQTGHAGYRTPKQSPVRDLLNSYFISLMIWR